MRWETWPGMIQGWCDPILHAGGWGPGAPLDRCPFASRGSASADFCSILARSATICSCPGPVSGHFPPFPPAPPAHLRLDGRGVYLLLQPFLPLPGRLALVNPSGPGIKAGRASEPARPVPTGSGVLAHRGWPGAPVAAGHRAVFPGPSPSQTLKSPRARQFAMC